MQSNVPTGRKTSGPSSSTDSSYEQPTGLDPATSPADELRGEYIRVTRPNATLEGRITRVTDPAGGKDRRITFVVATEASKRAVWAFPQRDRDEIVFIDAEEVDV